MGRELKRVALDFDWPLHFRWPGYGIWPGDTVRRTASAFQRRHDLGMKHGRAFTAEEIEELTERAYNYFPYPGIDPPAGEGYQIWETVSEGSPVSPVFATPEELAQWMVENDDSVTKDTDYEGWLAFINGPGWAPSMMGGPNGLESGVKAFTAEKAAQQNEGDSNHG